MAAEIFTDLPRATDANGSPLSGATWSFYASGTSTPQNVFANATLVTSLGSVVTADSGGQFAPIYFNGALPYRAILKTAGGATLRDIDPVNAGLASILASPTGAANVGFLQSGTGAVSRTLQAKLRDLASVKDFGAVGDGTTDDTAAVQAFANAGGGYVPVGKYRLTSPIEVPAGGVIEGVSGVYMFALRSGQTVFHIDHTGKGFTCTGATGGRAFRGIATLRNQPVPAPGWAPNANDWDFETSGATDVSFDDILLVNPTKGILHTNGGGRFSHNRVWGQPLQVGIQVDVALDVVRSTNVHFWNFWSAGKANEDAVWAYMLANGTAYYSKRNDNPVLQSVFSIFYRHGLRIGNFPGVGGGTTKRLHGFGIGMDACGSGLTLDADVNGATLELHAFYAHGFDAGGTGASLINIMGTNSDVRIYGKTDLSNADVNAVRVVGSGSGLTVNDLNVDVFNKRNDAPGYAVWVDPAAFGVTLRGETAIRNGVGTTQLFGGGGKINTTVKRSYVPTIASTTGAITAYSINSAAYQVIDGEVEAVIDFSITTNGTGSGSIAVGLPVNSAAGVFSAGYGNEVAVTGKSVRAHIPNNSATCSVLNFDNTYPGATGARIVLMLKYRV